MSAVPAFTFTTTAQEVATAFAQEIQGKNVLITAARVISKHANLVIITGYNDQRGPHCNLRRLNLDLGSLAGVRKAAAEVNTYSEPIHVLIHNAAATLGPFKLTVDGLESQIATDHVGPFLLTKLLTPKLLASATTSYTPRVIFVSSGAHVFGPGVDFSAIEKPNPDTYNAAVAYFQAKSANILTAIELSKRFKGAINAYSLHPGVIYTNLSQKEEGIPAAQAMGILGPDGLPDKEKFQWKTIPQGAATTVVASFDPRINDKPGAYLNDSTVANESIAPHSSDPANAEKLWAVTEKIIGETFTL
ncbi:hypothetical protein C8F04DRAFT_1098904 [Mycena alexandri]|uniref:Short-chain dehydrogenase/reductase n=1 Tax=Mycena alexandri TaxID=1745969 RepID=A0AAD6X4K5_9AGAR|nr:hypothetical protein C8F04DRAFT_1098904 [Mycena alexandri]